MGLKIVFTVLISGMQGVKDRIVSLILARCNKAMGQYNLAFKKKRKRNVLSGRHSSGLRSPQGLLSAHL